MHLSLSSEASKALDRLRTVIDHEEPTAYGPGVRTSQQMLDDTALVIGTMTPRNHTSTRCEGARSLENSDHLHRGSDSHKPSRRRIMTWVELAERSGVEFFREKHKSAITPIVWGYKESDRPNTSYVGYKSKEHAAISWAKGCGETVYKAFQKLLAENRRLQEDLAALKGKHTELKYVMEQVVKFKNILHRPPRKTKENVP
jgi:hypothetical protein